MIKCYLAQSRTSIKETLKTMCFDYAIKAIWHNLTPNQKIKNHYIQKSNIQKSKTFS